ncbi:hypothetical protein [Serratia fonticola]|uniref:hypothetical protein n=1 Tax=Serratia fonticola TaxID=47917 RepID=UPI001645504E|nr:hypothetical protein [Serratia fonticola]MBC3228945.1 hypothetical protein [Serratia fonticola]
MTTSVRFQQNTSLSSWLLIPPNGREYAVSYADIALLSRILPAQDRGAPLNILFIGHLLQKLAQRLSAQTSLLQAITAKSIRQVMSSSYAFFNQG